MILYYLLVTVHVIVCMILIGVVLLQSGKAADLAGAFGGMGSQTAFGPRGAATVLSKATSISAVLFMVTSLSLSIMATRKGRVGNSVLDKTSTSKPADVTPTKPLDTKPVTVPPPTSQAPAQQAPATPAPAAPKQ